MTQTLWFDNATHPINNSANANAIFGEIESRSRSHVTPTLNDRQFAIHKSTINLVVMTHSLSHTPTRNHIGDGIILTQIGRQSLIGNRQQNPRLQTRNRSQLLFRTVRCQMSIHNPFLRMQNAQICRHRNHLVNLIHIEVAPGSIIVLQQRTHCLIPTLQHPFFARIGRIKIDTAFCTTNWRTRNRKFHFHRLGQTLHFALIKTLAHPSSTAGSTPTQRINHNPTFRFGFTVLPSKYNLRLFAFKFFYQFFKFHDTIFI